MIISYTYLCDLLYLDVFGIFFLKWSYSEDVQRILLLAPALLNSSCLTGVACSHVPASDCFRLLQTASDVWHLSRFSMFFTSFTKELKVPKVVWIEAQEDCRKPLEAALQRHCRLEDVVAITAISSQAGPAKLFRTDNSISTSLKPLGQSLTECVNVSHIVWLSDIFGPPWFRCFDLGSQGFRPHWPNRPLWATLLG